MILRAPNTDRLIKGKNKTYLAAASSAASGTLTVESIAGFSIGQYLILGVPGEQRTEIVRIHTSTAPSGSTITLNANTVYRHEVGTPVYFTDYSQVEFSRATTESGAKTALATSDLSVGQMDTIYDDVVNTTGFGFYRFAAPRTITLTSSGTTATATSAAHGWVTGMSVTVSGANEANYNGTFTITVTGTGTFTYTMSGSADSPATGTITAKAFSPYSDAIPYAGYDLDAADTIFNRALSMAGQEVNPRLRYEDLYLFLNDFVSLANTKNARWTEAKVYDEILDTISTGDWEFALPSLIAKPFDPSSIINIYVRGYAPLKYVPHHEWARVTRDLRYTTVSTAIGTSDTEIVLTNTYDFADSGSIEIEGDTIAYTGNTRSTGTLTGVTGISATHAAGTYVFQGHSKSEPTLFTFSTSGNIRVWPICSSSVNNRNIYINYYKKISPVTSNGDKILVTNIEPAVQYVTYRIKKHVAGGTLSVQDEDFQQFLAAFDELIKRDTPGEPIVVSLK